MIDFTNVALHRVRNSSYPARPPFDPPERYPEFRAPRAAVDPENEVFDAVRHVLLELGLDRERFGSPQWNPLGALIRPGDVVVVKPNIIKEGMETDADEWQSVVTHPSVVRAVCDYVLLALRGSGEVVVCDAPQTDSSFAKIVERTRLDAVVQACRQHWDVPVSLVDLRNEEWSAKGGIVSERRRLPGDPRGTVALNLGSASEFADLDAPRRARTYYGADYDLATVNQHHEGGTHEYLLCRTPLAADVFINLPKLKTHKKTGVTLSLKNLVGINGDKNWLPHHSEGSPSSNGDQFPDDGWRRWLEGRLVTSARRAALRRPRLASRVLAPARAIAALLLGDSTRTIRSGNWYGNDTAWRMVLDLNKCLLHGRSDGTFRSPTDELKRYFSLIDGVVGMDGNGPMQGDPKRAGLLVGGHDPVAVDLVSVAAMGLDWRRLRILTGALETRGYPLTRIRPEQITVNSNVADWRGDLDHLYHCRVATFRPHFGWAGKIEWSPVVQVQT